jgi:hypothetical protein
VKPADRHQIHRLGVVVRSPLEDGADVRRGVAAAVIDDPGGVEQPRVEEILRQLDAGPAGVDVGDVEPIVAVPLDVTAQQAVAEAERHGGELGGDGRVDVGVVAGVFGQGIAAEQIGQILVVGDHLLRRDVELAGLLGGLLVGPVGVLRLERVGEPVVVAHEQGLEAGQLDVFVTPHVAGGGEGGLETR